MPWDERCRMRSLYEQLAATAGRFPQRAAITFQLRSGPADKAVTLSWAELRREVTRAANLFRRLGIGPADTVAYILPNGVEAPLTLLAGATAGIVNPVNPLLSPEHIASILNDTRAKVVVTLAPFPKTDLAQKVAEAVALAPGVETVLQVDLTRYLAPPLAWIVPLIRPKLKVGAPGAGARLREGGGARARRGARLRGGVGRSRLRLLPHRRHHGHAEGGAAPGARNPLQRLVRAVLHVHGSGRDDVPAADVPCLRRLSDPDVVPRLGGAGGDADAAGLSRRRGDGQLLEADRAAQGHVHDHRADRGGGADAAQGRRRRLDAAAGAQRVGGDAGRALPPLRGGDRGQGDGGLRPDRGDLPRRGQPARTASARWGASGSPSPIQTWRSCTATRPAR